MQWMLGRHIRHENGLDLDKDGNENLGSHRRGHAAADVAVGGEGLGKREIFWGRQVRKRVGWW